MKYMKFTPTLARGQEYYTGNVFEVYAKESKIKSSIGSGGRYDNLITNWINDGNKYPTVGISFGLNVIYEILKERADLSNESQIDVYIIPMNRYKESLYLADEIRNFNINVEVEMKQTKIRKCFEYANKEKFPFVIVVGDNEIENKNIKVKNMINGIQTEISLDNLLEIKKIVRSKD